MRPEPRHGLYTLGYEGSTIDAFLARLRAAGVVQVIDVRELPLSRKPGFSKSAFARALAGAGIGYAHRPALGCPKPIRDRYRADGDWAAYTRAFKAYLDGRHDEIRALAADAAQAALCLVCFEADSRMCHRSLVAAAAARAGGPAARHLVIDRTGRAAA